MKSALFFDLDGVLADWVSAFEEKAGISVELFNELSEEDKNIIKERVYSYEFFRNLKPLKDGISLWNAARIANDHVFVCSAAGQFNHEEAARAKRDWCKEHLGIEPSDVYIVERTVHKPNIVADNPELALFDWYVLFDDRQKAIDAWNIGPQFSSYLVRVSK